MWPRVTQNKWQMSNNKINVVRYLKILYSPTYSLNWPQNRNRILKISLQMFTLFVFIEYKTF
jgi:hypothetical protein